MSACLNTESLDALIVSLSEIREQALHLENEFASELDAVAVDHRASARNLLHYVALRRHDLRELQGQLSRLGLSSLGRIEPHVLAGLDAVLAALRCLAGRECEAAPADHAVDFTSGPMMLDAHCQALLGPSNSAHASRVMVTMPTQAASNPALVHDLLHAGMNVMRINGAHDDATAWSAMVGNLRLAEQSLGRRCRISFDLGGPKFRTGPIAAAAHVLKVKPVRDAWGKVVRPARLLFASNESKPTATDGIDAVVPVEPILLRAARPGDVIVLRDSRQRKRQLIITGKHDHGLVAQTTRTIYFFESMSLSVVRAKEMIGTACVHGLPAVEMPITLRKGDLLMLTRDGSPGRHATLDSDGAVIDPASISCTLGESFDEVLPGHRVFFDDGKIGGVVLSNDGQSIAVRIEQAAAAGANLRSEKGINLPDSNITASSLTAKDLEDLNFAVQHADMVCLSFVRRPEDVLLLQSELERRGGEHLGVVLKIETRQGFENLPRILLASLRRPPVGVMLARGDLAVEVGFERLAEVQEEILWLCEAAHVPVIWATQVLEGLAKTGSPSRAEVTDAAMGVRAECVMLNKGPFIAQAMHFLGDVLNRMRSHQHKKRSMLRQLAVSRMNLSEQGPAQAQSQTVHESSEPSHPLLADSGRSLNLVN